MKQILIKTDGTVETATLAKKPPLDAVQRLVGGWIQEVPHTRNTWMPIAGERAHVREMWCDEEGQIKARPYNAAATALWLSVLGAGPFSYSPRLYGDVVIYARD